MTLALLAFSLALNCALLGYALAQRRKAELWYFAYRQERMARTGMPA
ncbi:MAG: hypothetical protein ACH37Z_12250 [Anaerolineae bacterium]